MARGRRLRNGHTKLQHIAHTYRKDFPTATATDDAAAAGAHTFMIRFVAF